MNILSAIRRLAGRKGGKKQTDRQKENLAQKPIYNTATPAGLLDSLEDDDRRALRSLFNATIADAFPFNNVRRVLDGRGEVVPRRPM